MKYTNLAAFKKHIDDAYPKHFSPVYFIISPDSFARKQALDKAIEVILKDEKSHDLCLHRFDGERHSLSQIFQELETLSFFTKMKVIVVQNVEAFDKAATAKLETYFNSPCNSVCLILLAATVNRATTFYKKGEKAGIILDLPEEKPWEKEKNVIEWLRSEAKINNKELPLSCCQIMVKQIGTDQLLLQNELQKIICYVDSRSKIEAADIAAICTSVNTENAWQLSEAIFKRDTATALRITRALLDDGTALIALLRQIRSQFQTDFQICSMLAQGKTGADVSKEFPYMRGTILDKHLSQSHSYGMLSFKRGIMAIDKTELQAKNSGLDNTFLADMLIVTLTQK